MYIHSKIYYIKMLKSIETLIQTKVKANIPILEITGINGGYIDLILKNWS